MNTADQMGERSPVMNDATTRWHPVARSDDLAPRHVFHGLLLGRELALWRADDGHVNVWENRCLHRGVRLTLGHNEGRELRCQYHGWRYANRSAGCTYIPAHPADAPARTICNVRFPMVERYGLVWTGEAPLGDLPTILSLEAETTFGLRGVPVNAEPHVVLDALAGYHFVPSSVISDGAPGPSSLSSSRPEATVSVTDLRDGWIELTSTRLGAASGDGSSTIVFFVQPVDSARSVIRGVLRTSPGAESTISVLRYHSAGLNRLRDVLEIQAAKREMPEPLVQRIGQVSLELSTIPEVSEDGRVGGLLRVRVARKRSVGERIVSLELESINGQLPTFQPGAHIDVHLPNALVRQYSLVNGPGESDRYVIGVKREAESRGGSSFLHDLVRVGDVLAISEPRNNFPLRRDSFRTTLIAGGIGVTPLLAMAQALHVSSLDFTLHYFVQSAEHLAFADILDFFGDRIVVHLGLTPTATAEAMNTLLANPSEGHHAYICGPGPMIHAARATAAAAGWNDHAVHFEYFKNTTPRNTSTAFEVELARSALTLNVPEGTSIMEVLRAHGVPVASSCEQGACGTCLVTVLAGQPDHQDVYLNDSERKAGERMAICVSRSRTPRLVLDI